MDCEITNCSSITDKILSLLKNYCFWVGFFVLGLVFYSLYQTPAVGPPDIPAPPSKPVPPIAPTPPAPIAPTPPAPKPPAPPAVPEPTTYVCGKRRVTQPVVVGGRETYPGKWPWVVSIGDTESCGCLISNRWVLTCSHSRVQRGDSVRLGVHNVETEESTGKRLQAAGVFPHPDYNKEKQQLNDICLIKLSEPVVFTDYIIPCCLPTVDIQSLSNRELFVAGWGRTENTDTSATMLEASINVINDSFCTNKFQQEYNGYPKQFCGSNFFQSQSDCNGDSGSPIVYENNGRFQVVGLVSYGIKDCGNFNPSVYTNVRFYLDWIKSTVLAN